MKQFDLILTIKNAKEGITYKKLSMKTGLHINTVSRYVSRLIEAKYVVVESVKDPKAKLGRKWRFIIKPSIRMKLHDSAVMKDIFRVIKNEK